MTEHIINHDELPQDLRLALLALRREHHIETIVRFDPGVDAYQLDMRPRELGVVSMLSAEGCETGEPEMVAAHVADTARRLHSLMLTTNPELAKIVKRKVVRDMKQWLMKPAERINGMTEVRSLLAKLDEIEASL